MELPDCENIDLDAVYLSEFERSELIDLLVRKGEKGLDEFLEGDSETIGKKVEQLRKVLDKQGKRMVDRVEQKYKDQEEEAELKWKKRKEEKMSKEEKEFLEKSDDLIDRELSAGLESLMLSNEIVQLTMETDKTPWKFKRSLLQRIWDAIKRFFLKVWAAILRAWYWIRSKFTKEEDPVEKFKKEKAGRKVNIAIPFDGIRSQYNSIESKFGNALLKSPELQAKVDKKLASSKQVTTDDITLSKYSDPDSYVKAAKQMLRESLNEEMKKETGKTEKVQKDIKLKKKKQKEAYESYKKAIENLRRKRDDELRKVQDEMRRKPREVLKETLAKQMEDIGYLRRPKEEEGGWEITQNLVERFASLIFAEEIKKLPEHTRTRVGASAVTQGYYDKGQLRTVEEESRMDIVDSIVNARLNHPGYRGLEDSDITVKRDVHGSGVHVVIMFDRSGSMEENMRLDAAKRSVMALYKAIKGHDRNNIVDIIAFDTRADIVSLMDVWDCQPRGFTNTGEAIRLAEGLLNESKMDRRMVYLVTDGLPEAYKEGNEYVAGDPELAMEYALKHARLLRKYKNLRFILLLLEPEEEMFVEAAEKIVEEMDGKIITTDPKKLATDLLVDYIGE